MSAVKFNTSCAFIGFKADGTSVRAKGKPGGEGSEFIRGEVQCKKVWGRVREPVFKLRGGLTVL
jgi:hypothetical protein